jgi:hypothetical protein
MVTALSARAAWAGQMARDTARADTRKAEEHEAYKAWLRDPFGNRGWWAQ